MLLVNGGVVVYSLGLTVRMPSGHHTHIHCRAWGECVSVRRRNKDELDRLVFSERHVRLSMFGS